LETRAGGIGRGVVVEVELSIKDDKELRNVIKDMIRAGRTMRAVGETHFAPPIRSKGEIYYL